MQFSNRFAIAIHMFAYIHTYEGEEKMTSANLARSVNVNPVVIRQILSKLKAAGLLNSSQGSSHIEIAKNPEDITLLDIFRALDMMREDRLFGYHSAQWDAIFMRCLMINFLMCNGRWKIVCNL